MIFKTSSLCFYYTINQISIINYYVLANLAKKQLTTITLYDIQAPTYL